MAATRSLAVLLIARVGQFQSEMSKAGRTLQDFRKGMRGVNNLLKFAGATAGVGMMAQAFNEASRAARKWTEELRAGKKTLDEIRNTSNIGMVMGAGATSAARERALEQSQLELAAASGGSPNDIWALAKTAANKFLAYLTEDLGGKVEYGVEGLRTGHTAYYTYKQTKRSGADIQRYAEMQAVLEARIITNQELHKQEQETLARQRKQAASLWSDEEKEKQARMNEKWQAEQEQIDSANKIIESQKTVAQKLADYALMLDKLGLAGKLTQEQITQAMADFRKGHTSPMQYGSAQVISSGLNVAAMSIGSGISPIVAAQKETTAAIKENTAVTRQAGFN